MTESLEDQYGRYVRDEWVACKQAEVVQGIPVPTHHLTGYDGLDERNQMIDQRIGLYVRLETLYELYLKAEYAGQTAVAQYLHDEHKATARAYYELVAQG